jgi:hypothetical protein
MGEAKAPSRAQLMSVMTGREGRQKRWTERKRARFLQVLAATCNVQAACRDVKMSDSGAYGLRRRDATFRRDWRAAIAEGYARLEIEMLERALIAEERVRGALADAATDKDALDMLAKHPQRVAELLYRAHRQTALEHDGAADDDPDGEKALAEIRERVDKLRARLLEGEPE